MRLSAFAAILVLLASPCRANPTLEQLVELRDLSSVAISPDGRWVAFRQDQASIATNKVRLTWWVAPLNGDGAARRVSDGGTALWNAGGIALVEPPVWDADSRHFYFRKLVEDRVEAWSGAVAGSEGVVVVRDDADIVRIQASGPHRLAYVVGPTRQAVLRAEAEQSDGGVRIDKTVDPAQSLFGAVEINGRLAAQRFSGAWFWRAGLLGETGLRVKSIDTRSGLSQVASEAPETIDAEAAAMTSPDGHGRLEVKRRPSATDVSVVRADGSVVRCPPTLCGADRATSAAWRPGQDEVVLTFTDRFRANRLVSWKPATQAVRTIAAAAGALAGGATLDSPCGIGATVAVCVISDAQSAPTLARIDLGTGAATSLFAPNHEIHEADLEARRLEWTGANGRVFTGQLLRPKAAAQPIPLFITYYNCGGFLRGGTGDEWPLPVLAQTGIATLCINLPTALTDQPDAVAEYKTALDGISVAVANLARDGTIDPKRVGMGGHSFGSETTLWVAMKSDLLAAASISSLQVEPTYYWTNGVAGRDAHAGLRKVWGLGSPEETPERWREISPAANVASITAPLLIQMPEQELRVSVELVSRLSNSTTPSEAWAFAHEPHVLTEPRHRLAAYQRNLDWFRFWLLQAADSAPAKGEQYRRWQAMAKARQEAARASTVKPSSPDIVP